MCSIEDILLASTEESLAGTYLEVVLSLKRTGRGLKTLLLKVECSQCNRAQWVNLVFFHLGATVVGMVNRILPSSTGNSER